MLTMNDVQNISADIDRRFRESLLNAAGDTITDTGCALLLASMLFQGGTKTLYPIREPQEMNVGRRTGMEIDWKRTRSGATKEPRTLVIMFHTHAYGRPNVEHQYVDLHDMITWLTTEVRAFRALYGQ